jgi:Carboxypeptidase regulatory-like domain
MKNRILLTVFLAFVGLFPAAIAFAQADQSRVMGTVTDSSGGALPGVTVTLSGPTTPASVVTDGSGRYLTTWVAPGSYTLTFVLSGFETRTLTRVALGAGQTVVLDQQLGLGALSETVEVRAPAPPPPAPPAPPPPPMPRAHLVAPPKPQAKPVDPEILATVCGPRQAPEFSLAMGRVVSRIDDSGRQLIGPGELLHIDAGEKDGVAAGQNLVVRRRFQTGDPSAAKKLQTFGEQTVGLIQILDAKDAASAAIVVRACGEIVAGDLVERYVAQPAFFAVSEGTPHFEEPARIAFGEHGQSAASAGQMMVIDRGVMQGILRGQRLTIFRRPTGSDGPPLTIGDGVIIAVRSDSATILIDRTTDAVIVGDLVAMHR